MERQLQIGTNSLHQEPPKVRPSLVRSRIQFFSSLNKSTSSELPFVVTATEKGHQQATIKESTQPFSFGMREKADVNRETHGKGLLDVGRGSQSGISQESLACDGQLAMSSSNLSFSTFQKMDSTSFFVRGVSIERFEEFNGYTKKPQMPNFKPLESLETSSLLEALISEPKVANPDFIYNKTMERLNMIKEDKTLNKYILDDEEAATLCAVPLLMKAGLDFSEVVGLCKEKQPTKLFVLLLKSLRKLPQIRAVFYFGEANNRLIQRVEGSYLQRNFVVASKSMQTVKESLEKEEGGHCKEIFRVEGGWGYDIGDFIQSEGNSEDDFIIFEPWRVFSVADAGVKNEGSGLSVVLLNFVDEKLLYEKEIKPGMLQHIIPTLEENSKHLRILSEMTLDKRNCKTIKST